jgi:chorismate mutase-like protein
MTVQEARARLEEFRVAIDDVDRRIVALLNQRTLVVEDIGRVKREAHLPIYEPRREDQVFANIAAANGGPIGQEAVRRIFERIIDEMRTIQRLRMEQGDGREAVSEPGEKTC